MNRTRLIALLLALVTLMLYLPVAWHDFSLLDDREYVLTNPVIRAGLTWSGIKLAFTAYYASNWHPLTWLSHMLDCQLFGLNPAAPHLENVLFHIANTVLLFMLVLRWTKELWPSAIVAALFAWHPLHVESVAWIAERKDVLSTFFGLLTLLAYTRYAQKKERRFYWFTMALFACSLMCKPMLVTLPFVFLLLDWWPLGRVSSWGNSPSPQPSPPRGRGRPETSLPGLVLEKWPFFLMTIGLCLVTFWAQRPQAIYSVEDFPMGLRLGNVVLAYGRYLLHMVWPSGLVILYPLPENLNWFLVGGVAALLVGISVGAWKLRRVAPYLLFGWLWYLGTLVPVIGLVQAGAQSMADRYAYIPLVGIFLAMVLGLHAIGLRYKASRLLGLFAVAVLAAFAAVTMHQLTFWRSDEALLGRAVALEKDNFFAQVDYGVALQNAGHDQAAIEQYRTALQNHSKTVQPFIAHENLGILLANAGNTDEAMTHLREAVALSPKALEAHMRVGDLLVRLGRFDEALDEYEQEAQLDPADSRPALLAGKVLLRQGHTAKALVAFHESLQLGPDYVQTLLWLARVRAADEDADMRNGTEAVEAAERANELTRNGDAHVLDVVAMAYAETGRFAQAVAAEENAIKIATTMNLPEVAVMQERLQLYRAGKPYREDFKKQ